QVVAAHREDHRAAVAGADPAHGLLVPAGAHLPGGLARHAQGVEDQVLVVGEGAGGDPARPAEGAGVALARDQLVADEEHVHDCPNARETRSACSAWCRELSPEAGEAEAGRDTTLSVRPTSCGSCSDIRHQAPWFSGSSCTQVTEASGYGARAALMASASR